MQSPQRLRRDHALLLSMAEVTWFCFKYGTMVPEAGSGAGVGVGGWGLDVSVSCCEQGSGSQGTVQFPSTLRMEYVNFA